MRNRRGRNALEQINIDNVAFAGLLHRSTAQECGVRTRGSLGSVDSEV
jgi:hypothetical protein